jgi:hypothetical protein
MVAVSSRITSPHPERPSRGRARCRVRLSASDVSDTAPVGSTLPMLGLLLVLVLGLVGCQLPFVQAPTPTPTPTRTPVPDEWTALRQRPLHLPSLVAGAACPAEHARQVLPPYGPGIGSGPAYAALGLDVGALGVLAIEPPSTFQSAEWGGSKVLWYVAPAYHGPVLVRGHQLDGPNEMRFELGNIPPLELDIGAGGTDPGGSSSLPSYTRLRAPGCYAYQVDGTTFTEVIVFPARPA